MSSYLLYYCSICLSSNFFNIFFGLKNRKVLNNIIINIDGLEGRKVKVINGNNIMMEIDEMKT